VSQTFHIEVLNNDHDRTGFACPSAPLEKYFREQVSQDVRRRVATCYVAMDSASGTIAGYYTLAASSVPFPGLPEAVARKLPRYPLVPVARLGRLAVATRFMGRKLGSALLADAALRVSRSELGVYALVVDAKDEDAQSFYLHHGFMPLATASRQLMMPLARFPR
jgi:GNAT superfamily N-acetyltransferase